MSRFEVCKSKDSLEWTFCGVYEASGPKAAVDKVSDGLRREFPYWRAVTVANQSGKSLGRTKRFEFE